jgi:nicotinate-nucleotide adenylyltransferase
MKTNVAILGGAFDPITVGHVKTADRVLATGLVDEVWFMPCFKHRFGKVMAPVEDRLNMCKLAIGIDIRLKLSTFEIVCANPIKGWSNFSGETILVAKQLQTKLGKVHAFSFVIGMDNANTIDKWSKYEELINIVRFIVVPRKSETRDTKVNWYLKYPHVYLEDADIPEISSTNIRMAVKQNNIEFLKNNLQPEVLQYINKNGLYRS